MPVEIYILVRHSWFKNMTKLFHISGWHFYFMAVEMVTLARHKVQGHEVASSIFNNNYIIKTFLHEVNYRTSLGKKYFLFFYHVKSHIFELKVTVHVIYSISLTSWIMFIHFLGSIILFHLLFIYFYKCIHRNAFIF